MSRESMLIIVGVLLMLSPFVGLPLAILMWFYLAGGLLIALIGVSLRMRRKRRPIVHEASQTALP
ncbi:MAG: hypothetical protein AAB582_02850 [Patescibacteria group bacterium]